VWVIVPGAMLLAGRCRLRGVVSWLWLAVALALMSAPIARRGLVVDSLTMLGGAVGLVGLLLCCAGVIDRDEAPSQSLPSEPAARPRSAA